MTANITCKLKFGPAEAKSVIKYVDLILTMPIRSLTDCWQRTFEVHSEVTYGRVICNNGMSL